jgi:hypothetical protein
MDAIPDFSVDIHEVKAIAYDCMPQDRKLGCFIEQKQEAVDSNTPQLSVRIVQNQRRWGYALFLGIAGAKIGSGHPSTKVRELAARKAELGLNTDWWASRPDMQKRMLQFSLD